jgi:hypothetical protein
MVVCPDLLPSVVHKIKTFGLVIHSDVSRFPVGSLSLEELDFFHLIGNKEEFWFPMKHSSVKNLTK